MENRRGDCISGARGRKSSANSSLRNLLLLVFLGASFCAGCASPGEPLERKALVPEAIKDLAAAQHGNTVVLTFTLPKESVERRPLKDPLTIEIYRSFESAKAAATSNTPGGATGSPPALHVTIPSAMVDRYSERGIVRYEDPLTAEDFAQHSGWNTRYVVRALTSPKKFSADSNAADLLIFPASDPVDDLKAEVTHLAVVLTWTPPQKTIAGTIPTLSGFRIYRAQQSTPADATGAGEKKTEAKPAEPSESQAGKSPLLKIGESATPEFRDTQAEFGKTYSYSVRSIATYPGATIESEDSNSIEVTPKDIFPPSAPQGLVVVLVPAEAGTPASLDLSWAISPETDIAGYNVYRSDQVGIPGKRQNGELLLTPAFRDMNAEPGRRYFYTVTSVDRSGNESPASAAVSSGVPAETAPPS
jgi:hypothetical protein